MYDEWGDTLEDYRLSDLFNAHTLKRENAGRRKSSSESLHTYLRLIPEMRSLFDGPRANIKTPAGTTRHPALKGFDETDIISFGGALNKIKAGQTATVLMTSIPEFPVYPPETAWMREPVTDIPGLIVSEETGKGRVAFMPADLDRQYAKFNLPDHGNLIANIVRWVSDENIPIKVECRGMVDINMYRQSGKLIIHIVNLTSAGTWRQPVDEYIGTCP